ncbi:hypothetical protein FA15DRAFT_662178 [Coprinopsis marcescibilis]|uniref:Uncharacterized protein n=1 Tax=Coprinopsis marcescibilis TaxID=230819 RepID=A0A5C3K9Y7_COPMA|nr:hypothetical protein FA15DRAFT_662178 [Coprinopsis marcescibilis]
MVTLMLVVAAWDLWTESGRARNEPWDALYMEPQHQQREPCARDFKPTYACMVNNNPQMSTPCKILQQHQCLEVLASNWQRDLMTAVAHPESGRSKVDAAKTARADDARSGRTKGSLPLTMNDRNPAQPQACETLLQCQYFSDVQGFWLRWADGRDTTSGACEWWDGGDVGSGTGNVSG